MIILLPMINSLPIKAPQPQRKPAPSFRPRVSIPRLALAGFAGICALLLPSCYSLKVGTSYLALLSSAKPVKKLLADPALEPKLREFLELSLRIRAYAGSTLGLKESRNYRSMGDSGRDYIADVVQACSSTSFKRYLWSYPLVGKLPYKGFFEQESARAEAEGLKAKGYDVLVRPVGGFSTLGFLPDPLWKFMASYSEADLADLIIHELSHATVYKRGYDAFNEELATFIGERGARDYLSSVYGADSDQLKEFDAKKISSTAFIAYMRETAQLLDKLYAQGLGREETLSAKAAILSERARHFAQHAPSIFPDPGYRNFDFSRVNNAYLDLYRLYWGDNELYARYCDEVCAADLPAFIRAMGKLAKGRGDPKDAIRRSLELLSPPPGGQAQESAPAP